MEIQALLKTGRPAAILPRLPRDTGKGSADPAALSAAQRRKEDTIMNITNKLRYWRTYRRTVSELQGMSDRQLSDLGIGRSEISRVARQAAAA